MSQKGRCPGCDAYTSAVFSAFAAGEPCPSCGLAADTAIAVISIRSAQADEDLKAQALAAVTEAGRLRGENRALRWRIEYARDAIGRLKDELDSAEALKPPEWFR